MQMQKRQQSHCPQDKAKTDDNLTGGFDVPAVVERQIAQKPAKKQPAAFADESRDDNKRHLRRRKMPSLEQARIKPGSAKTDGISLTERQRSQHAAA